MVSMATSLGIVVRQQSTRRSAVLSMGPITSAFWTGYKLQVENWMDWTESMSLAIADGHSYSQLFVESWVQNFIWNACA